MNTNPRFNTNYEELQRQCLEINRTILLYQQQQQDYFQSIRQFELNLRDFVIYLHSIITMNQYDNQNQINNNNFAINALFQIQKQQQGDGRITFGGINMNSQQQNNYVDENDLHTCTIDLFNQNGSRLLLGNNLNNRELQYNQINYQRSWQKFYQFMIDNFCVDQQDNVQLHDTLVRMYILNQFTDRTLSNQDILMQHSQTFYSDLIYQLQGYNQFEVLRVLFLLSICLQNFIQIPYDKANYPANGPLYVVYILKQFDYLDKNQQPEIFSNQFIGYYNKLGNQISIVQQIYRKFTMFFEENDPIQYRLLNQEINNMILKIYVGKSLRLNIKGRSCFLFQPMYLSQQPVFGDIQRQVIPQIENLVNQLQIDIQQDINEQQINYNQINQNNLQNLLRPIYSNRINQFLNNLQRNNPVNYTSDHIYEAMINVLNNCLRNRLNILNEVIEQSLYFTARVVYRLQINGYQQQEFQLGQQIIQNLREYQEPDDMQQRPLLLFNNIINTINSIHNQNYITKSIYFTIQLSEYAKQNNYANDNDYNELINAINRQIFESIALYHSDAVASILLNFNQSEFNASNIKNLQIILIDGQIFELDRIFLNQQRNIEQRHQRFLNEQYQNIPYVLNRDRIIMQNQPLNVNNQNQYLRFINNNRLAYQKQNQDKMTVLIRKKGETKFTWQNFNVNEMFQYVQNFINEDLEFSFIQNSQYGKYIEYPSELTVEYLKKLQSQLKELMQKEQQFSQQQFQSLSNQQINQEQVQPDLRIMQLYQEIQSRYLIILQEVDIRNLIFSFQIRDLFGTVQKNDFTIEFILISEDYQRFYNHFKIDQCFYGVLSYIYFKTISNKQIDINLFIYIVNQMLQKKLDFFFDEQKEYYVQHFGDKFYYEFIFDIQKCQNNYDVLLLMIELYNLKDIVFIIHLNTYTNCIINDKKFYKRQNRNYQFIIIKTDQHIFVMDRKNFNYQYIQILINNINNMYYQYELQQDLQEESDIKNKIQLIEQFNIKNQKKFMQLFPVCVVKNLSRQLVLPRKIMQKADINYQHDKINYALKIKKKFYCNIYFDFETTFIDEQIEQYGNNQTVNQFFQNQQYLNQENIKIDRIQSPFCISFIIDCNYNFNEYIQQLQPLFNQIDIMAKDYIFKTNTEVIWGLECSDIFLKRIFQIQQILNEQISKINEFILKNCLIKGLDQIFLIYPYINVYSYNGSKFDNHFILQSLRNLHINDWHLNVQITGDQNNLKILKYQNITFFDLCLMLGGGRLDQMCKDYLGSQKLEFDMEMLKTWRLCQENKQTIVNYCLQDTVLLYDLHKKCQECIVDIIFDFLRSEYSSKFNINDQQQIFNNDLNQTMMSEQIQYLQEYQQYDCFYRNDKQNYQNNILDISSFQLSKLSSYLNQQASQNNIQMNNYQQFQQDQNNLFFQQLYEEDEENQVDNQNQNQNNQQQRKDYNIRIKNDTQLKELIQMEYQQWSTLSTLSMNIFKDYFNNYYLKSCDDSEQYEFIRNSYFGGYTQSFYIGEFQDDVFYIDFNSMYPFIMNSTNFPTQFDKNQLKFQKVEGGNISNLQKYLTICGITEQSQQLINDDPLSLNQKDGSFFHLSERLQDYSLFNITSFKFKNHVYAPWIPIRTKDYGTIYPLQYECENEFNDQMLREVRQNPHLYSPFVIQAYNGFKETYKRFQDQCKKGITVFGFQLRRSLIKEEFEYVIINKILYFNSQYNQQKQKKQIFQPIFKKFDSYLYKRRLDIKNTNQSQADMIKRILNSLYGKFGQKIFELDFFTQKESIIDKQLFQESIKQNVMKNQQIDHEQLNEQKDSHNLQFKFQDLNDDYFRPNQSEFVKVTVQNLPTLPNHIGSYVYIASLITAIGRSLINKLIQTSRQNNGRVFYTDTDSLMVDRQGFQNIQESKDFSIDGSKLGGLKNEFPLHGQQNETNIKQINILNKKVYQVIFKEPIRNKQNGEYEYSKETFKGVKDNHKDQISSELKKRMYEVFKQNGSFKIQQTRFMKQNGNINILEMELENTLRLCRNINDDNDTKPFQDIHEFNEIYQKDFKVQYVDGKWVVKLFQKQQQQQQQ